MKTLLPITLALVLLNGCSNPEKTPPATAPISHSVDKSTLAFDGFVDLPQDGASVKGKFDIGGWLLWGEGLRDIVVLVDGKPAAGPIQINLARPDVAQIHPEYQNPGAGWGGSVDVSNLAPGKHTLTVQAHSNAGTQQDLKTLTINVAK